MVATETLHAALRCTLDETSHETLGLPASYTRYEGKVRDNYSTADGRRVLVVTDRISAFDRVLGTLPLKGQILNRLAAWWFDQTKHVAPNHVLSVPDAQALVAKECRPLPEGRISAAHFDRAAELAMALFRFGQQKCAERGLLLVDTKYEFGVDASGEIVAIDEIHTPDSSRYWFAATYEERLAAGLDPESFDKEYVRRHLAAVGFKGDGPIPAIPDEVRVEASRRYIAAYEAITGEAFVPDLEAPLSRLKRHLAGI
jgi:phosphoribosylaminoimidazole-succinocarboxamide synthase